MLIKSAMASYVNLELFTCYTANSLSFPFSIGGGRGEIGEGGRGKIQGEVRIGIDATKFYLQQSLP